MLLEELEIFKNLLKENKIKIVFVLLASIISAIVHNITYKPKFTAKFEMAPYFEIASDLGTELEQISNAINNEDTFYVKQKLGNYNLNHNFINKSNYTKIDKGADYSFKHKNLKLDFELNDTNKIEMAKWSKAFVNFCNSYVTNSIRSYRGIAVYEEKLKLLSENNPIKNKKDSLFNFYKSDYINQNIALSDAVIKQIIYAQTLGEYKSAFKNNYYSKFEKTMHIKQRQYSGIEMFILISIVPTLILFALIRLIKNDF